MADEIVRPKRKGDWVGRIVRLRSPVTTKGGVVFEAGTVMKVTRNYGGLELVVVRPCVESPQGHRHHVKKLSEQDVDLLAGIPPDPETEDRRVLSLVDVKEALDRYGDNPLKFLRRRVEVRCNRW